MGYSNIRKRFQTKEKERLYNQPLFIHHLASVLFHQYTHPFIILLQDNLEDILDIYTYFSIYF